jgi:hypothetical protein
MDKDDPDEEWSQCPGIGYALTPGPSPNAGRGEEGLLPPSPNTGSLEYFIDKEALAIGWQSRRDVRH